VLAAAADTGVYGLRSAIASQTGDGIALAYRGAAFPASNTHYVKYQMRVNSLTHQFSGWTAVMYLAGGGGDWTQMLGHSSASGWIIRTRDQWGEEYETPIANLSDGEWHTVQLLLDQSGTYSQVRVWVDGTLSATLTQQAGWPRYVNPTQVAFGFLNQFGWAGGQVDYDNIEIWDSEPEEQGEAYTLAVDRAVYGLTPRDVGLRAGRRTQVDSTSYSLTGRDIAERVGRRLPIEAVSYSFAEHDVTPRMERRLPIDLGSYSFTGRDVVGQIRRSLSVDAVGYSLAGRDVASRIGRRAPVDQGDYSLVYRDVEPFIRRRLPADQANYNITGWDVDLLLNRLLQAGRGDYVLTARDVILVYTPGGGYVLSVDRAEYNLTLRDADWLTRRVLNAEAGVYALDLAEVERFIGRRLGADRSVWGVSAEDVGLLLGHLLGADPVSFDLVIRDVRLRWSGEVVPEIPSERVCVVGAEDRVFLVLSDERACVVPAESRVYRVQ
jgi:hypothetical protein